LGGETEGEDQIKFIEWSIARKLVTPGMHASFGSLHPASQYLERCSSFRNESTAVPYCGQKKAVRASGHETKGMIGPIEAAPEIIVACNHNSVLA
jgi:hypothetical protein